MYVYCIQGENMPLLQVRDFPNDIYEMLKIRAEQERRTIAQQTIVLLKNSLEEKDLAEIRTNKERRLKILERINSREIPQAAKDFDVVKSIRKDRENR